MILQAKQIEYWESRLNDSYYQLKSKVTDAFQEDEISFEKVKDEFREKALKKFTERLDSLKDDRAFSESVFISMPSKQEFFVLTPEERCVKIREICKPYAEKRDKMRELLISKPSDEEFKQITDYVKEMAHFKIEKQV